MNQKAVTTIRQFCATLLLFITFLSGAQTVEYVDELSTIADGSTSYYASKYVKLTDGTNISAANGEFFIKIIPTNPPPSLDKNFVRVEVPKVPVSSESTLTMMGADEKAVTYSYSDGLGRKVQDVVVAAGQDYEDVVQHYAYNEATGRQDQSFMPYYKVYSESGAFQASAEQHLFDFYDGSTNHVPDDGRPFTSTTFDDRGRVETVTGVGEDWASTATSYAYRMYDPATDGNIDHWKIESGKPVQDRHYLKNELTINEVTDVEGKLSRTVKDGRGLLITSQAYSSLENRWIGSFNVYDDFGRVRFVIPPLLTSSMDESFPNNLSTDQLNELVFQYEYDEKGRVKRDKAPGASWLEYVYDRWNRIVLSHYEGQEYNGVSGAWTFTKYDALSRPIMTGITTSSASRTQLQSDYDGNTAASRYEEFDENEEHGYTVANSLPTTIEAVLAVTYYDQYDFITSGWDEEGNDYTYSAPSGFTGSKSNAITGQTTGSKMRVLGSDKWLNTVVYYDDKRRIIQTISENHLGGIDRLSNELDWKGELQKMLVQHQGHEEVDVLTEYEYAHNGNLVKSWQTITEPGNSKTGDRILTAVYEYNVLGQVMEKNLHSTNGSTFLQSVDYDYNIKGWTSTINDANLSDGEGDLFGMQFNYTSSPTINGTGINGRYDGMIASVEWSVDNAALEDDSESTFGKTAVGYQYDDRNRLEGTQYATAVSGAYTGDAGAFNMTVPEYDDNGNIRQLTRKSEGATIDNLTYTYESSNQSNKLTQVTDAGTTAGFNNQSDGTTVDYAGEFDYNDQGQMTSDANKQIVDIRYNHLQLVDYIEFFDYTRIHYTYDAVGNRLSKEVKDADGNSIGKVDYVGLVEYYDEEINQVFTDEGRVYKQNDAYHYEYFITDHQGNNRVAFGNLPERQVYTATMETRYAATEESEFAFPDNIRSTAENHTPLGDYSVALNGTDPNRILGPAKVLSISAGDEVDLEVWAKYTFDDWDNSTVPDVATAIATAFGGASAGTGLEGASGSLTNALNGGGAWLFDGNESGEPEAYLQYLFFKTDYSFPDDGSGSGYVPVGADALDAFTKLASPTLTFDEPGYLFVYVVNESNQDAEVFFDDLKITHASSETDFRVTQVNDYYPFGLPTSNSWRAEGYIDPGLLYQSSFAHYDSLTGYYDFLSRSYDPVLGRFFAVDPMTHKYPNWSPYMGMANSPHMVVDPNGEEPFTIAALIVAAVKAAAVSATVHTAAHLATNNFTFQNWDWGAFGTSVGIGALTGGAAYGIGSAFGGVGGVYETTNAAGQVVTKTAPIGGSAFLHEGLRATAHGLAGVGVNAAFGQDVNFGTFASGFIASGAGSFSDGLNSDWAKIGIAGTSGGITRAIGGGNFYEGFAQGAIIESFNHLKHGGERGKRKKAEYERRKKMQKFNPSKLKMSGNNGMVSLDNRDDYTLYHALNNPGDVADEIISRFNPNITRRSLIFEIIGHAQAYRQGILPTRSGTAEMGGPGTGDNNRWFWDAFTFSF